MLVKINTRSKFKVIADSHESSGFQLFRSIKACAMSPEPWVLNSVSMQVRGATEMNWIISYSDGVGKIFPKASITE